MSPSMIRRQPIWAVTVLGAAASAVVYFLVMRLLEEALGGVINGVGVLLTFASILAPVALVTGGNRFQDKPAWAKVLIVLGVLVAGFLIWFFVVGGLGSTCDGACWD